MSQKDVVTYSDIAARKRICRLQRSQQVADLPIWTAQSFHICSVMRIMRNISTNSFNICSAIRVMRNICISHCRQLGHYGGRSWHVPWWHHQMETFSALLAICAGNSPVPGEFPAQRPVTRSFDVYFDLRLNKRLSKQSWGWWFGTSSCPLWRHCNEEYPKRKPFGIFHQWYGYVFIVFWCLKKPTTKFICAYSKMFIILGLYISNVLSSR